MVRRAVWDRIEVASLSWIKRVVMTAWWTTSNKIIETKGQLFLHYFSIRCEPQDPAHLSRRALHRWVPHPCLSPCLCRPWRPNEHPHQYGDDIQPLQESCKQRNPPHPRPRIHRWLFSPFRASQCPGNGGFDIQDGTELTVRILRLTEESLIIMASSIWSGSTMPFVPLPLQEMVLFRLKPRKWVIIQYNNYHRLYSGSIFDILDCVW